MIKQIDLNAIDLQHKYKDSAQVFNVVKNDSVVNIRLSGVIINSDPYGMGGINADDVVSAINAVESGQINIELNSPGGSVIAGTAIAHAIKASPAKVHVSIVGLAASAATFLVCAADTCEIAPGSTYMIHRAFMGVQGRKPEFLNAINLLDETDANITAMYVNKTGKSEDEISTYLDGETFFAAEKAVELGFVDKICTYEAKNSVEDILEDKPSTLQNENLTAKAKAKAKILINKRKIK
jgi:ATP-dependent Clp endopeptidase proteolytic subunit ClpP